MSVDLRLVSYNVLFGDRASPEAFARYLVPHQPDVIAFCEVPASPWTEQVGTVLGMPYSFTGRISTAGHVDKYKSLLSRFPLLDTHEVAIRGSRWGENCSMVLGRITLSGSPITLVSLHIPRNPGLLDTGVESITRYLTESVHTPVVLMGDFNATPDHPVLSHLACHGLVSMWQSLEQPVSSMEFPEAGVIDHVVYAPAERFTVLQGGTVETTPFLSDHKAIHCTLRFR